MRGFKSEFGLGLFLDRKRRPGLNFSLHENMTAKTERRISRWGELHESRARTLWSGKIMISNI